MGSAFIRYLLRNGEFQGKIVNLDLLTYAGSLEKVASVEKHPRYRFIQADIRDQQKVLQILEREEIDTVVHFAAESHVDRSIRSAKPFVETNVLGTLSLLEAVKELSGIHFHHVSTDEVYGSLGESGAFSENSPYRPNSPYSASKAASDHLVRAFSQTYQLSTTISHSSNNFGPYQYPEKLIPLMITNCLKKQALPVYGKGANMRDWVYVDDHAEAIWQILRFARSSKVYLVGGGQEISNLELIYLIIELLAEQLGTQAERYRKQIRFVADRPGHDYRYALNSSKMKEELNWIPKVSLKKGLKKTIHWYAARHGRTQQVG